MQSLRAKAQGRTEEQPKPGETRKKEGRKRKRRSSWGENPGAVKREDSIIAENRAKEQRCCTPREAGGAICRAGSNSTLGHASLARRRLAFDCFQGLQNFLPARGAGLTGVALAPGLRLKTEF